MVWECLVFRRVFHQVIMYINNPFATRLQWFRTSERECLGWLLVGILPGDHGERGPGQRTKEDRFISKYEGLDENTLPGFEANWTSLQMLILGVHGGSHGSLPRIYFQAIFFQRS